MEIIDAYWEKRNMDVETAEIRIERADSVEECRECLRQVNAEYQVVKLPTAMIEMQNMLQEEAFRYIESVVKMKHNLKIDNLNSVQRRLIESITYDRMDEKGIQRLFDIIRSGMFTTDRVALDPYFSEEQAHNRYIGWVKDELERNACAYDIIYKNQTVGFCLNRYNGDRAQGILGGLYPEYGNIGLGTISPYIALKIAKEINSRYYETAVSTNNVASMKTNISAGFRIVDIENVFIKHRRK